MHAAVRELGGSVEIETACSWVGVLVRGWMAGMHGCMHLPLGGAETGGRPGTPWPEVCVLLDSVHQRVPCGTFG